MLLFTLLDLISRLRPRAWVMRRQCANLRYSSFGSTATPYIGRGGITLDEVWTPFPETYMSICSPKMPNLFFYLGPNGGPGAGSFIAMLETVVGYIIQCIKKLQREHIASMEVR